MTTQEMKPRTIVCQVKIEKDDFGLFWTVFDSGHQGHIEIKFLEQEQATTLASELLRRELQLTPDADSGEK
jgi:hypothetical protein